MIPIHYIQAHQTEVAERLSKRGNDFSPLLAQAVEADNRRRSIQKEMDNVLAEMNKASKEIGQLYQTGKREEAESRKVQVGTLKQKSGKLQDTLREAEADLKATLVQIPNAPHADVPSGTDASANEVVREGGEKPKLKEGAVPHWDLASRYGIIDFELGNKITGSGFPVYIGKGAQLQRGLIRYFLDRAADAEYTEIIPPLMVNSDTAFGTGQLPDKEGQMYFAQEDEFYLIPTAEVPVTNIYRGDIIPAKDLPKKMVSYTPCFRREAGSYGKDVRGLNRVHQFDKVEIVQIEHPERSYETLQKMVGYVESLVQSLWLPYRILKLCGGDMGFASACTYDFEVYAAAQDRWLEVSSVSNFEAFQSNRMNMRYRDENNRKELVHTLNGSALALPRIVAALLENNQTPEGIRIPENLESYVGFSLID